MIRTLKIRSLSIAVFGMAFMVCPLGCGKSEKPVYPVQGQAFVQKKPAVGALVIFTPKENAEREKWPMGYPRGNVQADGSFKLTTYRPDDGAPAGNYAVTVYWGSPGSDEVREGDLLQGRYVDPATSKIHATVKDDRKGTVIEPFDLQ
jgi:hypothetical protein